MQYNTREENKRQEEKGREVPLYHDIHEFMSECFSGLAESPWLFESVDRLKETSHVFMLIDSSIMPGYFFNSSTIKHYAV